MTAVILDPSHILARFISFVKYDDRHFSGPNRPKVVTIGTVVLACALL
jgi:hypothetical protein